MRMVGDFPYRSELRLGQRQLELRRCLERLLAHVIARSFLGHEIPIIEKSLIGEHHRVARHAKLLGHAPRRWNGLFPCDLPIENGRHQRLADLRLQARMFGFSDGHQPIAQVLPP